MCTHCRTVFNPYSRKHLLVKCGKCPSCKQEKAFARANRIRNNMTDGMISLFVTLTYANDFLPYIKRSDLYDKSNSVDLPIYRNFSKRLVYDRHSNIRRWSKVLLTEPISYVSKSDLCLDNLDKINHPTGMPSDFLGVSWYPDVQDFYKRLRQILLRDFNYVNKFSYFTCSEYGGTTKRPHFHALLFVPRENETLFRSAIVKAWPFADSSRTAKFIEVARDCSNYVASYVNSDSRLLPLLESDSFRQKHSQSKNFGVVLDCFSLSSILSKIDSGNLFYYRQQKFNGVTDVSPVPIPLYVLHRYFPVCKGFGWLDSCQLRAILLNPACVGDLLTDLDVNFIYKRIVYDYSFFSHSIVDGLSLVHNVPVRRQCKLINPVYHYTPIETYRIYVRLENAYQSFHEQTGLSRFDYAFYYERVYNLYFSTMMKVLHEDVSTLDYMDFYDNANEVIDNPLISPTLSNLDLQPDPNQRRFIVSQTDRNNSLFYRMTKQKDVTNYVMSKLGYNV